WRVQHRPAGSQPFPLPGLGQAAGQACPPVAADRLLLSGCTRLPTAARGHRRPRRRDPRGPLSARAGPRHQWRPGSARPGLARAARPRRRGLGRGPRVQGDTGALLAAGARLVAVPVDRAGIEVEVGRAQCREARLAVVTPTHQFPTGVTMSRSRRLELLEWARLAQAWIVEDDWGGDYRFGGEALGALPGLR